MLVAEKTIEFTSQERLDVGFMETGKSRMIRS
jgi:hypothetical protein